MSPAQLLAHFRRLAEAPDAIPRLRRFVLDLAVRGKLVAQDPKDGSALQPLKRIRAEGTSPPLEHDDRWPIPSTWALIPVASLASPSGLFTDGDWVESKDQDPNGDIRLIQLADVGFGEYRNRSSRFMNTATATRLNCTILKEGDILIARMPDPLGRACRFPGDEKPCVTVVDVAVLRLGSVDLNPAYVVHAINSSQFARSVETKAAGTTRKRISRGNLSQLPFPLPPVAEQHRIVAKVDELLVLCDRLEAVQVERESRRDRLVAASARCMNDNARLGGDVREHARFQLKQLQRLTRRPEHLHQLRRTILTLAAYGYLVPQEPCEEPASELLKRAKQARRDDWEAGHIDRLLSAGKASTDETRKSKYKAPHPGKRRSAFTLPPGWEWVAWREVGVCQNGRAFPSGDYSSAGIRLLRPGNLFEDGSVIWNSGNTRYLPERYAQRYPGFVVGDSQIVMNLTAQSLKDAFLGRVCLTAPGERCLLNQRIARLKPYATTPRYTLWLFKSSVFRDYVDGGLNQGALIQHMFTAQVDDFEFPLPPLAEQRRIVAKVEELMALCDRLEAQVTTAQTESRRLLEALLHETLASAS